MIYGCLRCAGFALLAAVVVSVAGQSSEERALNSTGLWSKYNLIVKPTAVNGVLLTTPPGDLDARYKSPSKSKYNHKSDVPEIDRPYLSNHNLGEESESEEQYSQEGADDDEAEDDVGEEEVEEEEVEDTQTSEEIGMSILLFISLHLEGIILKRKSISRCSFLFVFHLFELKLNYPAHTSLHLHVVSISID
ncbi:hypothetical protein GE061_014614 [Apolygus lucorum]|uniref:Secreted protein n=1 Tax=Apolygus lucorum TaxID=248454 RepID=A0A8S9XIP9_APOLU|nr:hypothetical protein GE061_014614 [Apolygus lucorum]